MLSFIRDSVIFPADFRLLATLPWPGFEPGLLRPQRRVLTTRRSRLLKAGACCRFVLRFARRDWSAAVVVRRLLLSVSMMWKKIRPSHANTTVCILLHGLPPTGLTAIAKLVFAVLFPFYPCLLFSFIPLSCAIVVRGRRSMTPLCSCDCSTLFPHAESARGRM